MEGDLIKINEWLLPFSWLYGLGVKARNLLFDMGILKSKEYDIPVISIGNLTVGGTGKTPHTEFLLNLLMQHYKVAVLSRGYKRKSKGYVLAETDTPMEMVGDEPYQMKQKFPDTYVAVDSNRRRGIERLRSDAKTSDVEVILLDDAYQHRYVKPGINLLLVDYHRMITDDQLLPAGRLREPKEGKNRASMVVVTKCPPNLKPMDYRVIKNALRLYPYQKLFFSTFVYGNLRALFGAEERTLCSLLPTEQVLLLTGIALPEQMILDLERYTHNLVPLTFADHHYFDTRDTAAINTAYHTMPGPLKLIITTEKDAVRLRQAKGLSDEVKQAIYVLPVEVDFLLNTKEKFNEKILEYVHTHSRNSRMAKDSNAVSTHHRHHSGHRIGPSGFRD